MPSTTNGKHNNYQASIVTNDGDLDDDTSALMSETMAPPRRRLAVPFFTLGFVVLVLGSISVLTNPKWLSSPKQQQEEQVAVSSQDIPLEATASPPRACTFDECLTSRCDAEQAPFLCLWHNGGPHGGCSPVPWMQGTCDLDCNTRTCASLPVPDEFNCHGKPCSVEWCRTTGQQLCTAAAPFQCTTGAGRFGCTDDAFHWALYGCECCDATTCDV